MIFYFITFSFHYKTFHTTFTILLQAVLTKSSEPDLYKTDVGNVLRIRLYGSGNNHNDSSNDYGFQISIKRAGEKYFFSTNLLNMSVFFFMEINLVDLKNPPFGIEDMLNMS